MPPYRMLALDIDGTLVNSDDDLTPATAEAIRRARDCGIEVVLATGRRYSRTLPLVEPLGIELPLVTASGALVKHPHGHQTIFQAQFTSTALHGILADIAAAGYEAVLYTDSYDQGFDFYVPNERTESKELAEYLRLNPDCARVRPALMQDPPGSVFAGFAIGTRDEMLALEATLLSRWPNDLAAHVLRSPRYVGFMCELAPAGVSKWSAIEHLAELKGISAAEICAVGDDVNDLQMIRAAGLGVAMGNAVEVVKQAADRVAPCNNSDGLVTVVEWLLAES